VVVDWKVETLMELVNAVYYSFRYQNERVATYLYVDIALIIKVLNRINLNEKFTV
jgi:hypothetical protein